MKISVYLPDDLALRVKAASFNVSAICQAAVAQALVTQNSDGYLDWGKRHGLECIYCGSGDRRSLVLEFFSKGQSPIELVRCTPMCNVDHLPLPGEEVAD